ncbi:MAG: thioredoxin-like domain-containing protein [Bacteroidota bacterium]
MLKFRITLLITIWMCFLSASFAQHDYLIKFRIRGVKDTTCLVAYYFSNGTYIKDTLQVDHNGRCTYKAPSTLPKGLYALVLTDKNYFDFVVNNDYKFSMETTVEEPTKNMVIRDSPENVLFYEYLRFSREKFDLIQSLQNRIKPVGDKKDSAFFHLSKTDSTALAKSRKDTASYYSKKIEEVNKELIAYRLGIVKDHPSTFTTLMINTMKEPDIPEAPVLANGKKDSTFAYRYYKSHFWDDCDFTDDRMIRTPVFQNKLKKYYDGVIVQHTDTIMKETDALIEKSRSNPEMFKYLVWFTTYHYENSEIMGFDKVFVHVVDKYYATGQTPWISKETNEKLIKKATKLKPILIGEKAPNMVMQDTLNKWVSMHNIATKYLMILFWDPDCGHCQKELPIIKEFYDQNKIKYDLEIYAVCTDSNVVKWKKSIKKFSMNWINVNGPRALTGDFHEPYDIIATPVLYLLDDQKKIIAKRLSANQIPGFIDNYQKYIKKK